MNLRPIRSELALNALIPAPDSGTYVHLSYL